MSVIYLLLGVSITVAVLFFVIFWIAVRKGQFDDDYTPSIRMLFEDELVSSTDHGGGSGTKTHGNSNNLTNPKNKNGDSAV